MNKKIRSKINNRFYLLCGILLLTSELWKQLSLTFLINNGNYIWWYFPFQLCSIPMYVCLSIPFIKNTDLRGSLITFLMDYGLLGGIFAFFDTSGMHYTYFPLTIHSYLWHILLIIIGLHAGRDHQTRYKQNHFLPATFLYLACCTLATIFNLTFYPYGDINMFYISPHYHMQQKVFCTIAQYCGDPAGCLIYILSTIFGAWWINQLWISWIKKGTGNF